MNHTNDIGGQQCNRRRGSWLAPKCVVRVACAVIVVATAVAAWPLNVAWGGSIFERASARTSALYKDDTARNVGDNVTIAIKERGVIKNEITRGMDKKSLRTAKVQGPQDIQKGLDQATGQLFNLKDADININAETKFDGNANFDSDRSVTDAVTVTVIDVLPNGNLVVIGTRTREMEGDRQTIQISGIVRVSDISFDNVVSSEKVAEFRVVYKSCGMENEFTKPGWLDSILNFLNPW